MYHLKALIKCPEEYADMIQERLESLGVKDIGREIVPFGEFIQESRMYWDYVFPEMATDGKDVVYLTYQFEDTPEGREFSHDVELKLGWIPQNLHYITL